MSNLTLGKLIQDLDEAWEDESTTAEIVVDEDDIDTSGIDNLIALSVIETIIGSVDSHDPNEIVDLESLEEIKILIDVGIRNLEGVSKVLDRKIQDVEADL